MTPNFPKTHRRPPTFFIFVLASFFWSLPAQASFLAGEALDTAADVLALFILFVVPIGAVALFWYIHILPEKIAEQRQHPQKDAIKTLCLLSLVFGGLLWPFAWLWAYSKPVMYKLAYGRDKHDDYYKENPGKPGSHNAESEEVRDLKKRIDELEAQLAKPSSKKERAR
jgi:CBS domain containing-hemolysin-like protein